MKTSNIAQPKDVQTHSVFYHSKQKWDDTEV
jgi:hypothetical protein